MQAELSELTYDGAAEDGLLIAVVAVPHGDAGGADHGLPDVGSVDQVPEVLHPQRGSPLSNGEAHGVHHVGLAWCD